MTMDRFTGQERCSDPEFDELADQLEELAYNQWRDGDGADLVYLAVSQHAHHALEDRGVEPRLVEVKVLWGRTKPFVFLWRRDAVTVLGDLV